MTKLPSSAIFDEKNQRPVLVNNISNNSTIFFDNFNELSILPKHRSEKGTHKIYLLIITDKLISIERILGLENENL